MNITHRAGHNPSCPGSKYYIDEVTEDRKIHQAVIKYLKQVGQQLTDCTPPNIPDGNTELMHGINKANFYGGDLFFSIHLNAAEPPTETARGAEVWVYPGDSYTQNIATRICNNLSKLGFKNRGIKESAGLAELNSINYSSMIIECFFVDSKADVDLYKKLGADAIGKAIAEGITGQVISSSQPKPPTTGWIDLDGKVGIITAKDGLNVREDKSTNSKILGVLQHGEKVRLYRKEGDWIHVYYSKHGGYVHGDYIDVL